jgi:hypothetical protein
MGPVQTDIVRAPRVPRDSTAFLLLAEWIICVALLRDVWDAGMEVPSVSERPICLRFAMDKFGGERGQERGRRRELLFKSRNKGSLNTVCGTDKLACSVRVESRYKEWLSTRTVVVQIHGWCAQSSSWLGVGW